jgi:hypothetical protein
LIVDGEEDQFVEAIIFQYNPRCAEASSKAQRRVFEGCDGVEEEEYKGAFYTPAGKAK